MPLGGNVACLIILLLLIDTLLKVGKLLRLRPWRKIFQLAELDFLLLGDHQALIYSWIGSASRFTPEHPPSPLAGHR